MYLCINFNIQCLRTINCALSVSISVCCPQGLACHERLVLRLPRFRRQRCTEKLSHKTHLHLYICSADSVAQLPVCSIIYCGPLTPILFYHAPALPLANRWYCDCVFIFCHYFTIFHVRSPLSIASRYFFYGVAIKCRLFRTGSFKMRICGSSKW